MATRPHLRAAATSVLLALGNRPPSALQARDAADALPSIRLSSNERLAQFIAENPHSCRVSANPCLHPHAKGTLNAMRR